MATFDASGIDRLSEKFRKIANPDATPLMTAWTRIVADDNRRGVMAGTDKDGGYMVAVTYRPVGPKKGHIKAVKRQYGVFQGPTGQPTSAEYRRMTGPPLAPRGLASRVITNLVFKFGQLSVRVWQLVAYWDGVVNRKGKSFLQYHFNGEGRLPVRDLRGVRPEGLARAARALRAWMIDVIRSS